MRTTLILLALLLMLPVASAARNQQYEIDFRTREAIVVIHLSIDGEEATSVRRWADANTDGQVSAEEVAAMPCGNALGFGALRGDEMRFDGYNSRFMGNTCTFDGLAGPTEGGAPFTGQVRAQHSSIRGEQWLVATVHYARGGTLLARAGDSFRIAHHAGLTAVTQDGASVQGETSPNVVEFRSYAAGTTYTPAPEPAPARVDMTFQTPTEMRMRVSFGTSGVHALTMRAGLDTDASGSIDDAEHTTFRTSYEPTLTWLPNYMLAGGSADTITLDRFVAEGLRGYVDATGVVRIEADYTIRWASAPASPLFEMGGGMPGAYTMQAPSGHVLTGVSGIGVGTTAERLEGRDPSGRIQVRIEPAPPAPPATPAAERTPVEPTPAAPTPEAPAPASSPAPAVPSPSEPAAVAPSPSDPAPALAPAGEAPAATSDGRRTPGPAPGLAVVALALLALARRK